MVPRCLLFVAFGVVLACTSFGSTDATDAGTAPPAKRFCDSVVTETGAPPLYCRDFDDGQLVTRGWDDTTVEAGSSIGLDSTDPRSPPASFRARLEANAPSCGYARVIKNVRNV